MPSVYRINLKTVPTMYHCYFCSTLKHKGATMSQNSNFGLATSSGMLQFCRARYVRLIGCTNSNMMTDTKQSMCTCNPCLRCGGVFAKTVKLNDEMPLQLNWWQTDPQAACGDSSSWCWVLVRREASPPELAAPGFHYSSHPARGGRVSGMRLTLAV